MTKQIFENNVTSDMTRMMPTGLNFQENAVTSVFFQKSSVLLAIKKVGLKERMSR